MTPEERGMPLPLRILARAAELTTKRVRYEEHHSRGRDTHRFTVIVTAGERPDLRRVVIEQQIDVEAAEDLVWTRREAVIERVWRDVRERLLEALSDPGSEACKELSHDP